MRGLRARTSSGPSPSRSARPGRRLCRNTSDRAATRRSASRPSGARRLSASDRLPALAARKRTPTPSANGGPHARVSSPPSGRSTLITSAPSAPRISAQYGPASEEVTSRTRTPASGRKLTSRRPELRGAAAAEDALVLAPDRDELAEAVDAPALEPRPDPRLDVLALSGLSAHEADDLGIA